MKLRVEKADKEDVYRDIVRIPEQYRTDAKGKTIPEGSVCKITTAEGRKTYAILRGLGDETAPVAKIDERQRNVLGLRPGEEVELRLEKAGLVGQWRWAHNASDPAYRVVARLALYSLCLALLSVGLGILSLVDRRAWAYQVHRTLAALPAEQKQVAGGLLPPRGEDRGWSGGWTTSGQVGPRGSEVPRGTADPWPGRVVVRRRVHLWVKETLSLTRDQMSTAPPPSRPSPGRGGGDRGSAVRPPSAVLRGLAHACSAKLTGSKSSQSRAGN